jgi:hypothetical protein
MKMLSETRIVREDDFPNAVNAVTDESFCDRIMLYIGIARTSLSAGILAGGRIIKSKRYLIEPVVIFVSGPHFTTME